MITGVVADSDELFVATPLTVGVLPDDDVNGEWGEVYSSSFESPQQHRSLANAGEYVVAGATAPSTSDAGPVLRISKSAGDVVDVNFPSTASSAPLHISSNGVHAVWAMSEFESGVGFNYVLLGANLTSSTEVVYYQGLESVHGTFIDGPNVYWVQNDGGEIWSSSTLVDDAELIATGSGCSDVVVADGEIYALCRDGADECLAVVSEESTSAACIFSYETPYFGGFERLHTSAGRITWIDSNSGVTDSVVYRWDIESETATVLVSESDVGPIRGLTLNQDAVFVVTGTAFPGSDIWSVRE